MQQVICSPSKYVQDDGLISKVAELVEDMGKDNAYIIAGGTAQRNYKDEILDRFKERNFKYEFAEFGGEASEKEINKHKEAAEGFDIIVGIGGGKTLDTAKASAYYSKKPVIILPTAASTDAPCSRLSVIYTEDGAFDYYLFYPTNPEIVAMDTEVVLGAPERLLVAGMGDALATFYEAEACRRSGAMTMAGGHPTMAASIMPKLCLDTLMDHGRKALEDLREGKSTEDFKKVVEANTYLSGVGFESGGIAGAHAIHNGMTVLEDAHGALHGEKVAIGTLAQLILEDRDQEEIAKVKQFCLDVGLPTTLSDIGVENPKREDLLKVGELACDEDDTMGNVDVEVTPEKVADALLSLDEL